MRKNISVYSHHCNPVCDPPIYFISAHEAGLRVDSGYVRYLTKRAVQLLPPPGWKPELDRRRMFDKVWQLRFSDHFLVWQMKPEPPQAL